MMVFYYTKARLVHLDRLDNRAQHNLNSAKPATRSNHENPPPFPPRRQRRNPDASLTSIPEAEQKTFEGVWARGVCSNLETTCDMPDIDNLP